MVFSSFTSHRPTTSIISLTWHFVCGYMLCILLVTQNMGVFCRCNGQGIKPGRPALTPKPDMFPCHLCGRKLATREAHEVHIARCDGVNNNTRGRKPADNTCMVSEWLCDSMFLCTAGNSLWPDHWLTKCGPYITDDFLLHSCNDLVYSVLFTFLKKQSVRLI